MYRGRGGYNSNRGGRGGYNTSANTLQRANEFANQNMITVEIQGWDNAPQQDLINFLSRKARIIIMNPNVDSSGKLLQGQVRNMRDAQDLVKCSGMRFANQTLHIKIIDSIGINNNTSGNKTNTIELLRNFLRSRYNAQIKMLDLQNVQNDQVLVTNGLFSNASTSSKFFPALIKIAEQEKIQIESINLTSNNIDDHSRWLHDLALSFPDIKNIALSNNNIRRIEFFDRLKNKYNSLRELIIQGNPLAQDMSAIQKLISIFPRLIIIDGTQVRDEQKLNKILSFPVKSTGMFFENEDLSKIGTSFLSSYFNFWDNNRTNLMSLYTQQSQFSYQCDSSVITNYAANSSSDLWNNYTPHSRNLKRVSNEKSRIARLSTGPDQILTTFRCLPKTKHELTTNPNNYSVETISYPALNGMMINIHGEFEEVGQPEQQFTDLTIHNQNKGGYNNRYKNNRTNNQRRGILEKRSFDRVFIVVPGPNGAFIVASDMLCVKQYSGKPTWKAGSIEDVTSTIPVNSSIPTNPAINNNTAINNNNNNNVGISNSPIVSILPPDIAGKLNTTQQELVLKVIQETRLKLEFALMLCEQSNWDYNTAGQNFVNSKAQIPTDAYIQ
jgi:nuclear RNA export factor